MLSPLLESWSYKGPWGPPSSWTLSESPRQNPTKWSSSLCLNKFCGGRLITWWDNFSCRLKTPDVTRRKDREQEEIASKGKGEQEYGKWFGKVYSWEMESKTENIEKTLFFFPSIIFIPSWLFSQASFIFLILILVNTKTSQLEWTH